jgi:hypothetical protein
LTDPSSGEVVAQGDQDLDARPGIFREGSGLLGKVFAVTNEELDVFRQKSQ